MSHNTNHFQPSADGLGLSILNGVGRIQQERSILLRSSLERLGLTSRETEVLFWMIRGYDNGQIANQLGIHFCTVRKHVENIFPKLGVSHRSAAIVRALERIGVLD
jgi:ATP/maltotriose-dependent transcriptional regulator MalT